MMTSMMDAVLPLGTAITWEILAGLALRVTVVASVALLSLALLSRAAAATRHLVAVAALIAIVTLPLAHTLLPPLGSLTVPAGLVPEPPHGVGSLAAPRVVDSGGSRSSSGVVAAAASAAPVRAAEPSSRASVRAGDPVAPPVRPIPWPAAIALVALSISAFLLARHALGLLAAWWSVRRAEVVTDLGVLRQLDQARQQLEITRSVAIKLSPRISVPVVSGLLRPSLMVPAEALTWSEPRLRAVFLHELAHVRRHDLLAVTVGQVATTMFWFHPLVWLLALEARRECERACDDVVLSSGLRASDYADHLLAIARAARARCPSMTLAFARRSSLEGRLLSVLRPDWPRGPASIRVRSAIGLITLLLWLPSSSMRVVAAHDLPTAPSQPETLASDPHDSPLASLAPAKSVAKPTAEEPCDAEAKTESDADADADDQPANKHEGSRDVADLEDGVDVIEDEVVASAASSRTGASWYDKGRRYYDEERYGEAGASYEAAARAGHRPAKSWYNAACSFSLDGQKLRALGALEKAVAAGWDDLEHLQSDDDLNSIRSDSRFRMLLDEVRHSESNQESQRDAVAKYEELRSSRSADAADWGSAGISLMRSGETDLAVDAFQREAALNSSASAIYNQACAHALGGERDQALATLERAVLAGYGNGDKLRTDSDLYSLHGTPRFDAVVRLADDLTIGHRGKDDDDVDSWRKEVPRYERVAKEHPKLGRAWFNLGFVQLRAEMPAESRDSFSRALALGHRRPTTLYNLACAAAQQGETEDALRWLSEAESAGMDVEGIAPHDDDLDPLRSDRSFQAMLDRWQDDKRKEEARYESKKDKEQQKARRKS